MEHLEYLTRELDLTESNELLFDFSGKVESIRIIADYGCRFDSIDIKKKDGTTHTYNIQNWSLDDDINRIDGPLRFRFSKGEKLKFKTLTEKDKAQKLTLFIAERIKNEH